MNLDTACMILGIARALMKVLNDSAKKVDKNGQGAVMAVRGRMACSNAESDME